MLVRDDKHTKLILSWAEKLFTYYGAKVFCSAIFGVVICVRFA